MDLVMMVRGGDSSVTLFEGVILYHFALHCK
jgi:hypothetical protein